MEYGIKAPEDLKALTSLRFFAAMMIVMHHMTQFRPGFWTFWVPPSFIHGVSFFFVLSGFILTHVYQESPDLRVGRFIAYRIARLYPTVLASMLLVAAAAPWAEVLRPGTGHAMAAIAFALKLMMLDSAFPVTNVYFSWNSPSWSISTEMFFYLAFPLLLNDFRSTWGRKLLFAAICAVAVYSLGYGLGLPAEVAADNRVTLILPLLCEPAGARL